MKPNELIYRYLAGEASREESEELDRLLAQDADLRRRWLVEARTDSGLREIAMERSSAPPVPAPRPAPRWNRTVAWAAAAAAVALLANGMWTEWSRPQIVATLVSAENASWESSLPTAPGSDLTAGYLKLNSGLATIEFHSGAKVVLEAPSHLVLESPMRGQLLAGSAVIDVPESAIGFVMGTADGYAVDFGTQFAVTVDAERKSSDYEVLKGEIAVHHPATGREVRLKDRQGATINAESMVTFDGQKEEPTFEPLKKRFRISTKGEAACVIRNGKRGKHIHPDLLMVKQTNSSDWDMRTLLHFDVAGVNLDAMASVVLRLNQVPSGLGLAARLPVISRFAVYGLPHAEAGDWLANPRWESAQIEDGTGVKLGGFELPRSQQKGMIDMDGAGLMDFIKADADGSITLVIVRETGLIDGAGKGLFHAFASASHPEAAGPALVFERADNH